MGRTTGSTDFGFRIVDEGEKADLVRDVFSRVAPRYDLMNDAMSLGIHRGWKNAMIDWLAPRSEQRLLDLAGGTGDIAFRFLKRAPEARATVLDLTEAMLAAGRERGEAEDVGDRLDWVAGDATLLPFATGTFDACTIAFGLRNVTRREDALAEARRVLRRGGRFMVLEFSHVRSPALRQLYDLYSFRVIPALGAAIANDRDSYRYLVESIRRFPEQETLADMIRAAGFERVSYRNLSMGMVALHSGWKL